MANNNVEFSYIEDNSIIRTQQGNIENLARMIFEVEKQIIPAGLEFIVKDPKVPWFKLYTPEGILYSMGLHSGKSGPNITGKMAASYVASPESDRKKLNDRILHFLEQVGLKDKVDLFIHRLLEEGECYLTKTVKNIAGSHTSGSFKPHYRPNYEIEPHVPIIHSAINYTSILDLRSYTTYDPHSHCMLLDTIHVNELKNNRLEDTQVEMLKQNFEKDFLAVLNTGFPFIAAGVSHWKGGINRIAGFSIEGRVDTHYQGELKEASCYHSGVYHHGPFYIIYYGDFNDSTTHNRHDTSLTHVVFQLVPNELERTEYFRQLAGAVKSGKLGMNDAVDTARKVLTHREFVNNRDYCQNIVQTKHVS